MLSINPTSSLFGTAWKSYVLAQDWIMGDDCEGENWMTGNISTWRELRIPRIIHTSVDT